MFIQPANQQPHLPTLDKLRDAGISTDSDEEFADALDDLEERRRKLRKAVENDAREWAPLQNDE